MEKPEADGGDQPENPGEKDQPPLEKCVKRPRDPSSPKVSADGGDEGEVSSDPPIKGGAVVEESIAKKRVNNYSTLFPTLHLHLKP